MTGTGWLTSGAMLNGNNCPDNIAKLTSNSVYCGHAFNALGLLTLSISYLASMCSNRYNQGDATHDRGTSKDALGASVIGGIPGVHKTIFTTLGAFVFGGLKAVATKNTRENHGETKYQNMNNV